MAITDRKCTCKNGVECRQCRNMRLAENRAKEEALAVPSVVKFIDYKKLYVRQLAQYKILAQKCRLLKDELAEKHNRNLDPKYEALQQIHLTTVLEAVRLIRQSEDYKIIPYNIEYFSKVTPMLSPWQKEARDFIREHTNEEGSNEEA